MRIAPLCRLGWIACGVVVGSACLASVASAQVTPEDEAAAARAEAELLAQTPPEETIEIVVELPAQPAETRIRASDAERLPGVGGDALRVVQQLPGVARLGAGRAELAIWGAAPQDIRILVDGVPVPWLYHRGGWRSFMPSTAIDSISLMPAGFGVGNGHAIGGLVDIATTSSSPSELALDALDGALTVAHKPGRIALQAYGRASWLRDVVEVVAPKALRSGLVPYPSWWNVGAAATLERDAERFSLRVLAAGDDVTRPLQVGGGNNPGELANEASRRWFLRVIATWSERGEAGTTRWTVWGGGGYDDRWQVGGAMRSGWEVASKSAGLLGQRLARVGGQLLTAGLEAEWFDDALVRQGSLSNPAREGDPYVYGQPLGLDVAYDAWQATTAAVAPWVRLDYLRDNLTVSPGVRLDGYVLAASRLNPPLGATPQIGAQAIDFALSPRLDARWQADGVTLALQGGRYRQPRKALDTSATFGTPTLTLERAWHVVASVKVRQSDEQPVVPELALWHRAMDQMVVRDAAPAPVFGKALTQAGRGTAYGMQVVATLRPWQALGGVFAGTLTYNLTHSSRTAYGETRRFDRDQPHAFALSGSYQRGAWVASARFAASSGEPRTPVDGRYFDASAGQVAPIAGAVNSTRLPAFAQLDVRVQRALSWRGLGLLLAIDAQNLLGRANAEEYIYDAAWQDRSVITGAPRLVWLQLKATLPRPRGADHE